MVQSPKTSPPLSELCISQPWTDKVNEWGEQQIAAQRGPRGRIMLQSSLLQFYNPTHRNTGVSDPHSHHITRRVVVWGIFRYGLCIQNAWLNKELLKMLYFHSRGVRQFLGERGNTDWRRHADPCASNWQGQRVSPHIHHRICILTHDTHHILWLYERPQVIKYVCFIWVCDALIFKGYISQNGSLERSTWSGLLNRWRRTGAWRKVTLSLSLSSNKN